MRLLPPKRPRVHRPRLADGGPPEPDTVRAFLVAPAVPAAVVGLGGAGGGIALGLLLFAGALGVGYASAILLGLPLYLAVPERVRRSAAATAALGGLVAAAPWLPFGAWPAALAWSGRAFVLGGLGGLIFGLVRHAPFPPDVAPPADPPPG